MLPTVDGILMALFLAGLIAYVVVAGIDAYAFARPGQAPPARPIPIRLIRFGEPRPGRSARPSRSPSAEDHRAAYGVPPPAADGAAGGGTRSWRRILISK